MNAQSIRSTAIALVLVGLFTILCPTPAAAQSQRPPIGVWRGQDARGATVTMVVTPNQVRLSAAGTTHRGNMSAWEAQNSGGVLTVRYPQASPPNDRNRYYVSYQSRDRIVVGNQSFRVDMRRVSR